MTNDEDGYSSSFVVCLSSLNHTLRAGKTKAILFAAGRGRAYTVRPSSLGTLSATTWTIWSLYA